MSDLFFREKPIIGLDIGVASLKIMALDTRRMLVSGYGTVDLNPEKLKESLDGDGSYLAQSLAKLLKENIVGILPSNHTIMGIPAGRTYSRTVTLPIDAEKNLKEAIELEAEQYIPVPVESLYIDYEIIERTKKQLSLVMTAAPKKIVDNCLSAARTAGLRTVMVEPSTNAIARMLKETEEGHLTTAIIDINSTATDIAILDSDVIKVTGSVGVGGNTFTRDISKKLGISLENAHQYKILNGLSKGPRQEKITRSLNPSLRRISDEVSKVIRFYSERVAQDSKVEQLLIVGSGSNIPGLGEYFTNSLIMPARVASPWQTLDFGKLPQPHKRFRPRYITVTGLASVNSAEALR